MNIFWGFTTTKKILHFEMNKEKAYVFIRACPANILGWIISFFVRSNETTIKINENLFICDEWSFFRRNIMYIPVKSITSISMRENFRTILLALSILSFMCSTFLIYTAIHFSVVQKLQMMFFFFGVFFMALAFFLKQRVYITIYRGNHTHELKFRASDDDLNRIKQTLEMIMFLSTGGELPQDHLVEPKLSTDKVVKQDVAATEVNQVLDININTLGKEKLELEQELEKENKEAIESESLQNSTPSEKSKNKQKRKKNKK